MIKTVGDSHGVETVRDILATAVDPMVVVGLNGRIVALNAQAEQLLGYRREDLVHQSVGVLAPGLAPVDHPAAGTNGEVLLTLRRQDGANVTAEVDIQPVSTEAGLLIAVLILDL